MRNLKTLLGLAVIAALTAPACHAAADTLQGRIVAVPMDTKLVRTYKPRHRLRETLVYTPPGYDDPANAARRYPVVYLLHGAPGSPLNFHDYGHWPEMLEQQTAVAPAILVMPDGNYVDDKHGDSEWVNSSDGQDRFEDWLVKEIVPWADSHYRTIATPAGRVLGGVSEGAYGALNLTLRNPRVFGSAFSLSGYFDNDGSGWARTVMGYDDAFLRANSPLRYVDPAHPDPAWKSLHLFLGVGEAEKPYTAQTRAMAAKLSAAGVPVTLRVLKGKHGWDLWNGLFADGIALLLPSHST